MRDMAIKPAGTSMCLRLTLLLIITFLTTWLVACGGDDDDAGSASTAEVCDNLNAVREDLNDLRQAVRNADRSDAQAAIDDMRNHLTELRDEIRNAELSTQASQSAADLAGAVDGLQTTMRQAGQGGDSLVGIIQQLEIQQLEV
jgi:hypothetical protein